MNDVLATLNPQDFERFIADLWQRQGWQTGVTSSTGDRGIDIIAERSFPYSETCLIQAKCYSPPNKIGSEEVRKYATLDQQENADTILIVTSSEFTSPARSLGEDLGVKLISGEQLLAIIGEINAQDILEEYVGGRIQATSDRSRSGSQASRNIGRRNTNQESRPVVKNVEVASNVRTALRLHRQHAHSKPGDKAGSPMLFMFYRRGEFAKEDYIFDVGIHYVLCRDAEERGELGNLIGKKGLTVQNTEREESGTRVIFTQPDFRGDDFDVDEEYSIIKSVIETVYGVDIANLDRVAFQKNPDDEVNWESDDSPRETVDNTELDADCPECGSNLSWNPNRNLGECHGCGIDLKFRNGEWRSGGQDSEDNSDSGSDPLEKTHQMEDAANAEPNSLEESHQDRDKRKLEENSQDSGGKNGIEQKTTGDDSTKGTQTRTVEQQSKNSVQEQTGKSIGNERSLLDRLSDLFGL